MADLFGHPDTYKPTRPGRLFLSSLSGKPRGLGSVPPRPAAGPPPSAAGILWSRLCSADCVGSIPPNVYFVLLRRTRIHRAPSATRVRGWTRPRPPGHQGQRHPTLLFTGVSATCSPLVRRLFSSCPQAADRRTIDTSSLAESSDPSDKALRVHDIWTETCLLRGAAPSSLFFRH